MADKTGIANQALILLGEKTVTTLDEESEQGRTILKVWNEVRDACLRAHPWKFARKRASLAQIQEVPEWGYQYQFQLPTDCLRVYRTQYASTKFIIEGDKLLTDENTMNVIYIARIENEGLYDSLFVSAMAARLAATICYKVTNSTSLIDAMWKLYQVQILEAAEVQSQEGYEEEVYDAPTWIDARQ